jgi:hypothetical protein
MMTVLNEISWLCDEKQEVANLKPEGPNDYRKEAN